jgi:hypothetical protein
VDVVSEAVAGMGEQIAILSDACDALSHRELITLLVEVSTVLRSVPALEHRVLARLMEETEPCRLGEASWKKVLTTALRVSGAEATRRVKRAKTLGPRRAMTGEALAPLWESTAAAQARGLLDEAHVAVVAQFHKALPSWVDVETRAAADAQLAELGSGVSPEDLKACAEYLRAKIDQDGPEPDETERARRRGFRFGKQHCDGYSSVSGWVSAQCRAVLEAIFAKDAAPGRNVPDAETPDEAVEPAADVPAAEDSSVADDHDPRPDCRGSDTRTQAQRQHDALLALGRRALESGELGRHNGLPVTVIASVSVQELQKGAGVAVTGGGSWLPMRDLIQMAAAAYHYLYVYDEHSGQSLYLARTRRLANAAQRIVCHARDRGCTRPGCTAPGYWCEVHHAVEDWIDGGHTNVDDLAFACRCDHRMLDKTRWRTRKNTKNQTEWLPPPDLDTGQHRVNGYHHPERYLLPEDKDNDKGNDDEGP